MGKGGGELGLFSLGKGRLINVYKYLTCRRQRDVANLFSAVPSNRTRGNGNKQKHRKKHKYD